MRPTALFLILFIWAFPGAAQEKPPVIDVHLHAGPGSEESTYYEVRDEEAPQEAWLRTLREDMEANNVVYGIVGGPPEHAVRFREAVSVPLIATVALPCIDGRSPNFYKCYEGGGDWPDPDRLRAEAEAGRIGGLGELYNVYAGISPRDPRMQPYVDLAAKYDLIVAVHADRGPPPDSPLRASGCCPDFDGSLGDPALWQDALSRHPDLRVIFYHTLRPEFVESAIALMDEYPNVVAETSPMTKVPTPWVHDALRRYIEAGHIDRVVFGSDYLGSIGESLAVIDSAEFLSATQKRAILYGNAARFLGLSDKAIARHRGE